MGTLLIIVLIFLLLGVFPMGAAYNASWGYGPSGILGIVLIVVIILLIMGRL